MRSKPWIDSEPIDWEAVILGEETAREIADREELRREKEEHSDDKRGKEGA